MVAQLLEPDLIFDERGAPAPGPIRLDDGRVTAVGPDAVTEAAVRVPLPGRMLVPGLVNAHSHAFQRALRGRVEARSPDAPEDDFWSWRERMYACARDVDEASLETLTTWAYADMLRAGFTAVGEFHYLHHGPGGRRWGQTASAAIVRAAQKTGIDLTLLQTAYERGGLGVPANSGQARFVFDDVAEFLHHARDAAATAPDRVRSGVAVHSVRACSRAWIEACSEQARDAGWVIHAHACEQRAELETCRIEHGVGPLELLDQCGALGDHATIVHATHIDAGDVSRLASTQTAVCLCPSTERNLGDGLCPIADLADAGVVLCVGTDSHARIDAIDELRSLEDHERLRTERRVVLTGQVAGMGGAVLPAGTRGGARSLGIASAFERGSLVAVRTPIEAAAAPQAALDAWLVGGSSKDVTDVWVGGKRVVEDGQLTLFDEKQLNRQVRAVLASL